MNKSYTLHAILFAFFFTACSEPSATTGEDGESQIQRQSAQVNGPASEAIDTMNSGEMTGTYAGTLPCGDCEGIKTTLSLKDDDSFILKREYIGKEGSDLQITGIYEFNENSKIITLVNASNGPERYLLENGKIWQLNKNSKKVEGDLADKYVLTKNFE